MLELPNTSWRLHLTSYARNRSGCELAWSITWLQIAHIQNEDIKKEMNEQMNERTNRKSQEYFHDYTFQHHDYHYQLFMQIELFKFNFCSFCSCVCVCERLRTRILQEVHGTPSSKIVSHGNGKRARKQCKNHLFFLWNLTRAHTHTYTPNLKHYRQGVCKIIFKIHWKLVRRRKKEKEREKSTRTSFK